MGGALQSKEKICCFITKHPSVQHMKNPASVAPNHPPTKNKIHHYEITNKALPLLAFGNPDQFLELMKCETSRTLFMDGMWDKVCEKNNAVHGPPGFMLSDIIVDARIERTKTPCILFTMPEPDISKESHFVGMVFPEKDDDNEDDDDDEKEASPTMRYFLLQKDKADEPLLIELKNAGRDSVKHESVKVKADIESFLKSCKSIVNKNKKKGKSFKTPPMPMSAIPQSPIASPKLNMSTATKTKGKIKKEKKKKGKKKHESSSDEEEEEEEPKEPSPKETEAKEKAEPKAEPKAEKKSDKKDKKEKKHKKKKKKKKKHDSDSDSSATHGKSKAKLNKKTNRLKSTMKRATMLNSKFMQTYRILFITIYGGRDLCMRDEKRKREKLGIAPPVKRCPYVAIYSEGELVGKTRSMDNTINPVWGNGSLGVRFPIEVTDLPPDHPIECRIFDGAPDCLNDPMGTVIVTVPEDTDDKVVSWHKVGNGSGSSYCQEPRGELQVGVVSREVGHHYEFAHEKLPEMVFANPWGFWQSMNNPNAQKAWLEGVWVRVCENVDAYAKAWFTLEDVGVEVIMENPKVPIVFFTMPQPRLISQAYFIAVTMIDSTNGEDPGGKDSMIARYFVLEVGEDFRPDVSEWKDNGTKHYNYDRNDVGIDKGQFIDAINDIFRQEEEDMKRKLKDLSNVIGDPTKKFFQKGLINPLAKTGEVTGHIAAGAVGGTVFGVKKLVTLGRYQSNEGGEDDDGEINDSGCTKTLFVTIHAGRNLVAKDKDMLGRKISSDPYVTVWHRGKEVGRTLVMHNTLNPAWGGSSGVTFPVSFDKIEKGDTVECRIFDFDNLRVDDPMGTVSLPIPTELNKKIVEWYAVGNGQGTYYCSNPTGELMASLYVRDVGHHYEFAHVALPKMAFASPLELFGILNNESRREKFLEGLWSKICKKCDNATTGRTFEMTDVEVERRTSRTKTPLILFKMPKTERYPQCYFMGIIFLGIGTKSEGVRYFMLSMGLCGSPKLCEYKDKGTRLFTYGDVTVPINADDFVAAARKIVIDESDGNLANPKGLGDSMRGDDGDDGNKDAGGDVKAEKTSPTKKESDVSSSTKSKNIDVSSSMKSTESSKHKKKKKKKKDKDDNDGDDDAEVVPAPPDSSIPPTPPPRRNKEIQVSSTLQAAASTAVHEEESTEKAALTDAARRQLELLADKNLTVSVYAGRNLVAKDRDRYGRKAKSDPYVSVYFMGKRIGKTDIIKRSLDPVWAENMSFSVPVGRVLPNDARRVELHLYDDNLLGKSNTMGIVEMMMPQVVGEEVTDWYSVDKGYGKLFCHDASGELKCGMMLSIDESMRRVEPVRSAKGGDNKEDEEAKKKEMEENIRAHKAMEDQISKRQEHLDRDKTIIVTIFAGRNLVGMDQVGSKLRKTTEVSSDPYVEVYFAGDHLGTTAVIPKTLRPVWGGDGETFKVDIGKLKPLDGRTIQCRLFDKDRVGSDDPMGCVTLGLPMVDINKEVVDWHPVEQGSEELGHYCEKASGELKVGITVCFTDDVPEKGLHIRGMGSNNVVTNDIDNISTLSSLSGADEINTQSAPLVDKIIVVTIQEGRNLVAKDRRRGKLTTSDPFVEVYYDGDLIGKTKTIKKTLAPVWNNGKGETFEVHLGKIPAADHGVIQCRIFDYDSFGASDPMGAVILMLPETLNESVDDWYKVGRGQDDYFCNNATGEVRVTLELKTAT